MSIKTLINIVAQNSRVKIASPDADFNHVLKFDFFRKYNMGKNNIIGIRKMSKFIPWFPAGSPIISLDSAKTTEVKNNR